MAVKCFSLYLILAAIVIGGVTSEYIEYNTKPRIVPEKINVHLVPHSHDDVGWLKTVDQYYVGSNNSIRGACVQNVLDSVIASLLDDENRKFIYVEMAFFQRWWRQQSNAKKVKVKKLVDSGQLEFINGGMCMHDEATPHYIDMIDQTTLGHQFIKTEFGQVPRVGWQIDPFGHSAVQAYLLGAEFGFDSLFFARIDYQDRAKRLREKTLEVIWQGSKSLGSSSQIFTGVFPRHYDPPEGFTFEINDVSAPIQDDPLLFDYNVQERVNDFVAAALAQVNVTRTNHIMWLMGTDFRYQYAYSWFRQIDKFIHYVNKDGRLNVLYSTPSIYTDAKYAANESWPLKTDDFFPYADKPNAYWTGYFTSRPAFKKYVRDLSGYYLAARQLEFLRGRDSSGPTTDMLADALAIAQHHDAVSGTQRQHVAADYALRLSMGYLQAEKLVASSLSFLSAAKSSTEKKNPGTKFQQCPLLNISYCPASEARLLSGKSLVVVVYNSLGWKREEVVRVPVSSENVIVKDASGKEVVFQLLPLSEIALRIRNEYVKAYLGRSPRDTAKHVLAFTASVPPLGFSSYVISDTGRTARGLSASYVTSGSMNQNVEVGQGNLKLRYSEEGVKITRHLSTKNQVTAEQSYAYYIGSNGTDKDPQASGAYVFRPDGVLPIKSKEEAQLTIVQGPLFDEVHQELNSWISQITRVYKGKNHAEIEFTIGPIPADDGISKEIITKLTTTMKTNGTFYTDSNGRDFIKRIRDFRTDWDLQVYQPVAGNYYPLNLGIYMQDKTSELSVLVDRAVGGSSLENGQIELMLHRRMQHDDIRGVGEILNETVCLPEGCKGLTIQGKFYVQIDKPGDGAKWRRTFGQEIYSPLLIAFTEQEGDSWINSHKTTFSAFEPSYSLPKNVALLTLQELENGEVLLRLAHLFEVGEDSEYSVMAKVELKKLFHNKKIREVKETSLSGNQEKAAKMEVEGKGGEAGTTTTTAPRRFALPVDAENKATTFRLFSVAKPHMRAFHLSWFQFFCCFVSTFAAPPLLPVIRENLNLTATDIGNAGIASVSGAVFARIVMGTACDLFGPRLASAALTLSTAPAVYFTAGIKSPIGFIMVRFFAGFSLATFVSTQFWMSSMFSGPVVGSANGIAAGWGNLGGGATQLIMPIVFSLIRNMGATKFTAWRIAFFIPGLFQTLSAFAVLLFGQDLPDGDYWAMHKSGEREKDDVGKVISNGIKNYRGWITALAYGYCFGVELTIDNIIAEYFFDRFHLKLQTAGIIAASFGLANFFARPGGGIFSDFMSRRFGMRGRLWAWWIVQTSGGVLCACLGQISSLTVSIIVMLVFSVFVQAACGLTFGVVPFISRRSLGVVSGMTGAGGNVGAVLTQLIFFKGSTYTRETGITLMGVMSIACSLPICLIYFPQWGGMFCGPSSKKVTEEDYYLAEWNDEEKEKNLHIGSQKFAETSISERGRATTTHPQT